MRFASFFNVLPQFRKGSRLGAESHVGRNYLKGRDGDHINAVLAAAGFNFHLLLRWLATFLRAWALAALMADERAQII